MSMEEVSTVKLMTNLFARPWSPNAAVCASPLAALPVSVTPVAFLAGSLPVSAAAPAVVQAAERSPISQEHQVKSQVLARELVSVDGIYGTSGFGGGDARGMKRRLTDATSGVPPRGRPVC
jgi:hypothetical protein